MNRGRHVSQRLARLPMITRIPNPNIEMFVAPGFLSQNACDEIKEISDQSSNPSEVANSNGDETFRTSRTTHLSGTRIGQGIRENIAMLLGIPYEYAETIQAQQYGPGQEFKPHCDWFTPGSEGYAEHCEKSGQRTWTAMAYLNNVEEGGQTVFSEIGHSQKPAAGTLLIWNNLTPDGEGNPHTLHHAMPVIKGKKYVITTWFREYPWL